MNDYLKAVFLNPGPIDIFLLNNSLLWGGVELSYAL